MWRRTPGASAFQSAKAAAPVRTSAICADASELNKTIGTTRSVKDLWDCMVSSAADEPGQPVRGRRDRHVANVAESKTDLANPYMPLSV
jgi:hypothetical protein